jgi:hypothetical protein
MAKNGSISHSLQNVRTFTPLDEADPIPLTGYRHGTVRPQQEKPLNTPISLKNVEARYGVENKSHTSLFKRSV